MDASKNAYQKLLEAYNQAESTLNAAKQAVSDIEKAIEEQEPGGDTDYTEELKAAASEISDQFTYGSNMRGSAEYRHHLGRVLLRRCMEEIQKKEEQ